MGMGLEFQMGMGMGWEWEWKWSQWHERELGRKISSRTSLVHRNDTLDGSGHMGFSMDMEIPHQGEKMKSVAGKEWVKTCMAKKAN